MLINLYIVRYCNTIYVNPIDYHKGSKIIARGCWSICNIPVGTMYAIFVTVFRSR